ncbi:uncharacterized protein LOC142814630 [Rhipicephalus microplus]|uniref:uncharacterized protein LOC142814630 n=1 Tax=Rhipicephalus microplus TaxID=6941 RepID=UPI003F6C81B5
MERASAVALGVRLILSCHLTSPTLRQVSSASSFLLHAWHPSTYRRPKLVLIVASSWEPQKTLRACWCPRTPSAIFVHCAGANHNVSACAAMHPAVFTRVKHKDNVDVCNVRSALAWTNLPRMLATCSYLQLFK